VKDPNPSSEDVYSLNYNTFIGVCLQGIKDLHNRHQPELAKVATLQSDLTIEKEKVVTLQSDLIVEKEKVATLQSDVAVEKEKVATLQTDLTIEKEKVATLQTDVDREKLKTTNLQERILVMEQAYHALLERVSDLENS
jgi:chromosome segregation ATPase